MGKIKDNYENNKKMYKKILKKLKIERMTVDTMFKRYKIVSKVSLLTELFNQLTDMKMIQPVVVSYNKRNMHRKFCITEIGKKYLRSSFDPINFLYFQCKNRIVNNNEYPDTIIERLIRLGAILTINVYDTINRVWNIKQYYYVKETAQILKNQLYFRRGNVEKASNLHSFRINPNTRIVIMSDKVCILTELTTQLENQIMNKLLNNKPLTLEETKYPFLQNLLHRPEIQQILLSNDDKKKEKIIKRDNKPSVNSEYQILL